MGWGVLIHDAKIKVAVNNKQTHADDRRNFVQRFITHFTDIVPPVFAPVSSLMRARIEERRKDNYWAFVAAAGW